MIATLNFGKRSRLIRQPVGIHDCAVVTAARRAVDEKIAAAMATDVSERDRIECLVVTRLRFQHPHHIRHSCASTLVGRMT
jgi:hypothetical protein